MTFGPRGARDPILHTRAWRKVQAHWRAVRPRPACEASICLLPGVPIDWDGPYWVVVAGRRTINPAALNVGHIVSRRLARALGWTTQQTNDVRNTRPEHARCSMRSGARDGNVVQRAAPVVALVSKPKTSRQW